MDPDRLEAAQAARECLPFEHFSAKSARKDARLRERSHCLPRI